ncbi:hypothetical protein E2C01_028965 [Portunus trituberculatus]|uniref:Uncharacterized protein n=1 Tax=Portunus trituberculatus TaxID=210409 RepID=A0A5B7ELV4_PORTR|nr:hypothetical protein [Portunus trituberculatus]
MSGCNVVTPGRASNEDRECSTTPGGTNDSGDSMTVKRESPRGEELRQPGDSGSVLRHNSGGGGAPWGEVTLVLVDDGTGDSNGGRHGFKKVRKATSVEFAAATQRFGCCVASRLCLHYVSLLFYPASSSSSSSSVHTFELILTPHHFFASPTLDIPFLPIFVLISPSTLPSPPHHRHRHSQTTHGKHSTGLAIINPTFSD